MSLEPWGGLCVTTAPTKRVSISFGDLMSLEQAGTDHRFK